MGNMLKQFLADIDRATTAKRVTAIGRLMADHLDRERGRLLKENERLRAALEPFANEVFSRGDCRRARRLLNGKRR